MTGSDPLRPEPRSEPRPVSDPRLAARRLRRSEGARRRRREIEACLARWNLLRRPRPVHLGGESPEGPGLGARLHGALLELGPVFAGFGKYLSSRVDLLAAGDAVDLAAIPDRVLPLPIAAVRDRIAAELGRPFGEVFSLLEPEPFDSRLLLQAHRGRLLGGEPVVVRLARPALPAELVLDLELLSALAELLAERGPLPPTVVEAATTFRQDLFLGTDLRFAAQSLEWLSADAEFFGRLAAPRVHPELTTTSLLVHGDLGGISLGGLLRGGARPPGELARILCTTWLRQAFAGRVFPTEIGEEDVRALPDGRIGFQGIALARSPLATAQADLRDLVLGVAARDPDAACNALLRVCAREAGAGSEEDLRMRLRQIFPFRDGGWSSNGESLAENLFVYARFARAGGYRPPSHLVAFYRGLFEVSGTARRLDPERDGLLEGLQELRVLTGFAQFRDAMRPDLWGERFDRYAMLIAGMPQGLDELLSRAAGAPTEAEPSFRPPRPEDPSHGILVSVLLVGAALALMLHHLVEVGVLEGRGEGAAALFFLAVGGFLLWSLGRAGGRDGRGR